MFPKKNRSFDNANSRWNNQNGRGGPRDRGGFGGRASHFDRNNAGRHDGDRYERNRRRRTPSPPNPPPGSRYGSERRENREERFERSKMQEAIERAEAAERLVKELQRKQEIDEEAQSQRFGAFGDDSSDDCGGAPVRVIKKKDKKRRRRGSSSSSSSSRRRRKHRKYSDDDEDPAKIYTFLKTLNISQPIFYTQTVQEKRETPTPNYEKRRKIKKRKIYLDPTVLKTDSVEYYFPVKEPTETLPGVYQLESVPYDINNSASVAAGAEEIDWERMTDDEFLELTIMQQNIFSQSSATKKVRVYLARLRKTIDDKVKLDCYINLVNLEDARVEESRKSGKLTGRFDTTAVKLDYIAKGIKECKNAIDLRLLEIEILTKSKGENSEEVKKAWDTLMNQYPNDLKMWRRRLTYCRNKRSLFNATDYINNSVNPCLNKLGGIINGTFVSHPKQEGTEEFMVEVIVSVASLYIEMGSTYKAIGILQALIEFYLLVPIGVKEKTFKEKLIAFECYWKTPIAKVGHIKAPGWIHASATADYKKYDFAQNNLLNAEEETAVFKNLTTTVFSKNVDYLKDDMIHSNCERWSNIEQIRTENFWEPIYNAESAPPVFKFYNRFLDIKPYLMQLPQGIIEKAVFRILTKLGAVFPGVKDYSQEAIFQRCDVQVVDVEAFKIKFHGMKIFIDNVLLLMSGLNHEMYLYATIARLMTAKAFILRENTDLQNATNKFKSDMRNVMGINNLIRQINDDEKFIITSYSTQLHEEIRSYCSRLQQAPTPVSANEDFILKTITDIFVPDIQASLLFALIRYYVMVCRDLPHYVDNSVGHDSLTKLKFLMKLSFPNSDVDYKLKTVQKDAIQKWINVRFHENDFGLPAALNWVGDINCFAREILSTLCYEIESDPVLKFEAFDKFYSDDILKSNEDLTEIYFKTWNCHWKRFFVENTAFMKKLRSFIDVFPKNDILTNMYVEHLRHGHLETRDFFLMNQHEDDIVNVLRCIVQIKTEFEKIQSRQHDNPRKESHRCYFEVLKNSAELSSTNLIPESYLWRCALYFIKNTRKSGFDNTFLIANDQCPWSKTLLIYAASLSSQTDFVVKAEGYAEKAGIQLMVTLREIIEDMSK